jgi:hypothetical protein
MWSHVPSGRRIVVLGAAMIVAAAAAVHADTIYSNLGPNDTWSEFSWSTREPLFDGGSFHVRFGTPFTVDRTATVESLQVPFDYSHADVTGLAVFSITEAENGIPGAVIESFGYSSRLVRPGGSLIDFRSTLRPTLIAGSTYFLTFGTTGNDGDAGHWYWNQLRQDGSYSRQNDGAWVFAASGAFGAFRLSDASSATPEPASLLLITTGLIAALARRRT